MMKKARERQKNTEEKVIDEDEVVILQLHDRIKDVDSSTDDAEDDSDLSLEEAFRTVGNFGWFQIRLLLFKILYQFPAAFNILAIAFVGLLPEWSCSTIDDLAVPLNHTTSLTDDNCGLYENDSITCNAVFTDHFYSIAQEWELICDQSYLVSLTQSGMFLGYLLGSFFLGYLSDLCGRRIVIILTTIALGIVQILMGFSLNIYMFAIGRFIVGLLIPGGTTAYILFCELTDSAHRSLASFIVAIAFGFSYLPLTLTAYLLANWRWVTIMGGVLNLLVILLYRIIPESPRWLLTSGKEMNAKQAFVRIARVNGRSLAPGFSLKIPPKPSTSFKLLALVSNHVMRVRLLLMMFEWFTLVLTYYTLSLGVGSFSQNIYLAFSLSGLVEIPSSVIIYLSLQKFGRKWNNIVPLLITGLSCLCCSIVLYYELDSTSYLTLSLSLIGKCSVTAAFIVVYIYTPELVPTDSRLLGMGVVNVCGRIGGILAPLVILLNVHVSGLSMLIMGVLCVVSGLLGVYLPETLNTPLPNTMAEITLKII